MTIWHKILRLVPYARTIINSTLAVCRRPTCRPVQQLQPETEMSQTERDLLRVIRSEIIEVHGLLLPVEFFDNICEFKARYEGSLVQLNKACPTERITVLFDVTKGVIPDHEPAVRNFPDFEVIIRRHKIRLCILCSFNSAAFQEPEPQYGHQDVFNIDRMCVFDKQWSYNIQGSCMDIEVYDLVMELLLEKGITNEFAEKVSDLATAHEHYLYIEFLNGLSKFAAPPTKLIKTVEQ